LKKIKISLVEENKIKKLKFVVWKDIFLYFGEGENKMCGEG
jgi:hypothetical protein